MPVEIFPCSIEEGNTKDRYVVSIVKRDMDVIGHVPRKISAACCIFIRRGGSISCKVTSKCRYSHHLPQGGLEVQCILTFKGTDSEMMKLKKLLNTPCSQNSVVDRSKRKKMIAKYSKMANQARFATTVLSIMKILRTIVMMTIWSAMASVW